MGSASPCPVQLHFGRRDQTGSWFILGDVFPSKLVPSPALPTFPKSLSTKAKAEPPPVLASSEVPKRRTKQQLVQLTLFAEDKGLDGDAGEQHPAPHFAKPGPPGAFSEEISTSFPRQNVARPTASSHHIQRFGAELTSSALGLLTPLGHCGFFGLH